MQRQPEQNPANPQEEHPFDWEAMFQNAGITGMTFGATGLASGRPLSMPLIGAVTSLTASRAYGSFFQAGRNKHSEQNIGRMLGIASTNTLFVTLAFIYKIDPMAALLVTMVLAASFLALSKLVPHPDNAPAPARRPGQG